MGSGSLPVYATPAMIALLEGTSCAAIEDQLEGGQTTVGTALDVKHVAASPIGATITCEAELIEVDRRSLTFRVTCVDDAGTIGEGIHQRFVVDAERFLAKAEAKLQ
jgi:predicted thioesterase